MATVLLVFLDCWDNGGATAVLVCRDYFDGGVVGPLYH